MLRVGNLQRSIDFYTQVLGMQLLRTSENPEYKYSLAFLGFEVQIMGDSGEKAGKHSTGAIYDVLPPTKNMAKPEGEWNQYEITCKGPLVTVILNGEKIIDTDFSTYTKPIGKFDFPYCNLPKEGWVGVQNHGGEIWFKKIEIKELK